jgi:hypothetical protein
MTPSTTNENVSAPEETMPTTTTGVDTSTAEMQPGKYHAKQERKTFKLIKLSIEIDDLKMEKDYFKKENEDLRADQMRDRMKFNVLKNVYDELVQQLSTAQDENRTLSNENLKIETLLERPRFACNRDFSGVWECGIMWMSTSSSQCQCCHETRICIASNSSSSQIKRNHLHIKMIICIDIYCMNTTVGAHEHKLVIQEHG